MDQLEKLFSEYEDLFSKLDFQKMSGLYGNVFISAGPHGTIAESREEFLEKADNALQFYSELGMRSAKILSRYELSISDQYSLVTIHWGVAFEQMENKVEFDISYIVHKTSKPYILMVIAHQDEMETINKLREYRKVS